MANEDQAFSGVVVAVGTQSAFGTVDGDAATVAALTHLTAVDLTDFVVLGDAESGDAESGVAIPNIVGVYRKVQPIAGSFTKKQDAFQKANVEGFAVSWVMQGNGASATPTVGEADLSVIMPGVEAIFNSAGLVGSVGAAGVEQDYNFTADPNIYTTWALWYGDLKKVFNNCLVDSLVFKPTPGGNVIATANVLVGTYDHTTEVDGFTLPTPSYGVMASLAGPTVEGVVFTAFGQTRGFEDLTVTLTAETASALDSNVDVTGVRIFQTGQRVVSVSGRLYCETTDSAAAIDRLSQTTEITEDLTFQVGTKATGAGNTINAFEIACNNLQPKDLKYDRTGTALVCVLNNAEASALAAGAAGDEFQLTMN